MIITFKKNQNKFCFFKDRNVILKKPDIRICLFYNRIIRSPNPASKSPSSTTLGHIYNDCFRVVRAYEYLVLRSDLPLGVVPLLLWSLLLSAPCWGSSCWPLPKSTISSELCRVVLALYTRRSIVRTVTKLRSIDVVVVISWDASTPGHN